MRLFKLFFNHYDDKKETISGSCSIEEEEEGDVIFDMQIVS